jgi:hypothetical protein
VASDDNADDKRATYVVPLATWLAWRRGAELASATIDDIEDYW